MVYKIFNDGIDGTIGRKAGGHIKVPQLHIQTESVFANSVIKFVKLVLFVYDIISLPLYFILQRPDRRAKEAQRTRSERVDKNTWIKTDPNPNETSYLLHGLGSFTPQDSKSFARTYKYKYMGSTLSEIFANAVQEFSARSCLGYRAVVTCPVLTCNEEGQHVVVDKSFRSDYTWYTYEQIGRRVQDIASGLYYHSVYPGSRALFLANTSLEWFSASQACYQLAAQLVVAPEINDEASLKLILKQSEVDIIFASCDRLHQLCGLFDSIKSDVNLDAFRVKKVVLIDWQFSVDFAEPAFAQLRDSSKHIVNELLSMAQIEEAGVEHPIELCCTRALNQGGTPDQEPMSFDVAETREIVRATRDSETNNVEMHSDDFAPPSTVPLRRRSEFNTNGQVTTDQNDMYRKKGSLDKQRGSLRYTVTKDYQLDAKSSTPRLRIDKKEAQKLAKQTAPQPNDLAMIVYTHGSLGQIKGVMLTHSYLARSNHYLFLDGMVVHGKDIHCTTLSLDNVIEFMTEMCVFSHGGSIGYSCNPNTLFYDGKDLFKRDRSDLGALNPTFLLVRPYILESLRTSVQNYLSLQLNPLMSFILTDILYDYKKYWARRHFETPIVDRLFCSELKKLFGLNLKYILCNGATDCSETKDFFAFMVNIPVIELYGPEEATVSLISVNDIWDYKRRVKGNMKSRFSWMWLSSNMQDDDEDDNQGTSEDFPNMQLMPPALNKNIFNKEDSSRNLLITSSILCPTLGTRIRLEDWEDFRAMDQPYPRGRLVIGGDVVCKGYYKMQKSTSESFYIDSNFITWFRTGDIARVFPNGSFEIISGMSDMIKMVDGQFISLSQIEHILRNSQFVENVCAICGDDRKFVIALVVPNLRRLALKSPGEANLKMAIGMEPQPEELIDVEFRQEVCNDRLLCEFVNEHLSELLVKSGLQAIPNRFHLVPEIWTPETELVTPSFEPKRNAIQKYYASDIQSLFKMEFTTSRKRLSKRIARFSSPGRFKQIGGLHTEGRFSC